MKNRHCKSVNQTSQGVRIIGDPVLHQPGRLFPTQYSNTEFAELMRQINIAKTILIKTGGGGIAANQCIEIEHHYQFAIVGVFYENPEHVLGVTTRYPKVNFPQALIMLNPVILEQSTFMQQFNHGCLSVPCPNRCAVLSPKEITVNYLDPLLNLMNLTTTLTDEAAVALWHEMNHILDGKTYIDTTLASLSDTELDLFETLVAAELKNRISTDTKPQWSVPPFYFSVILDENNQPYLDKAVLKEVLTKMDVQTLIGIDKQCKCLRNAQQAVSPSTNFF